ncbi:hypothetical protein Unana1_05577 [Umbelopsis nana]
MSDSANKTIVVVGITGKQGGSTAQALLDKGFKVRGITRDVNSSKSKAWAAKGVELVTANLNDKSSLETAFKDAYGVFLVTDHLGESDAVAKEVTKGKNAADAAIAQGVKHFVFTSVGNAGSAKFPEFYNKYEIEQYILKKKQLISTVIRPANFFENYAKGGPFEIKDGVYIYANRPEVRVQAVGVRDIGRIAAEAFLNPVEYNQQVIELSGEDLTGHETAAVFSKVSGQKYECKQMFLFKLGFLQYLGSKYHKMANFWEKPGYSGDVKALRAQYPWLQTWEEYFQQEYGSQK